MAGEMKDHPMWRDEPRPLTPAEQARWKGKMTVPEALENLEAIRKRSPGTDVWNREVTRILDAVWLQAYEEGKENVFG